MNKPELLKRIADKADCSIDNARKVLTAIEEVTMEAIACEDKVTFSFGVIGGRTVPAKKWNNPRTKQVELLPEKPGQPYYKPSAKAKEY